LLLVCELFRAHEMRSQLEVAEMFEPLHTESIDVVQFFFDLVCTLFGSEAATQITLPGVK